MNQGDVVKKIPLDENSKKLMKKCNLNRNFCHGTHLLRVSDCRLRCSKRFKSILRIKYFISYLDIDWELLTKLIKRLQFHITLFFYVLLKI